MSSKIIHPPGGLPHTASTGKQQPQRGAVSRGAGKSGAKRSGSAASSGHDGLDAAPKQGAEGADVFAGDRRDEASGQEARHRHGQEGAGAPSTRPHEALAPRAGHSGVSGARANLQRTAGPAEGRRPEHAHWARLLSQASPERLAQGQALLGQHESALQAFAKLVPGFIKPR